MPWPFADIAEPDYDSDFSDVPAVLTALTTSDVDPVSDRAVA